MPKYWVKNYFAHGRFPEVGQKQRPVFGHGRLGHPQSLEYLINFPRYIYPNLYPDPASPKPNLCHIPYCARSPQQSTVLMCWVLLGGSE